MADATDTARTRLDRALAELERKVRLRAAPATVQPLEHDEDLFARIPDDPRRDDRVVELEAAAREAAEALGEAAAALKSAMSGKDA